MEAFLLIVIIVGFLIDFYLRQKQVNFNSNKELKASKEYYTNTCKEKAAELEELLSKIQVELEKRQEVSNSLEKLQVERNAILEANRQEEAIKLKEDFYKINLKPEDYKDIELLKSIEPYLANKEALYKLIWTTFYAEPTKQTLNRIVGRNKTSGIYKITNQANHKAYVGQSVDLHSRLANHVKAALGVGTIAHQTVHEAMGEDNLQHFTFEILEKCDRAKLNEREKHWIQVYATDKYGYNKTAGGAKEN